jgi:hypothetical protein
MTEAKWLRCQDPTAMLQYMQNSNRVSARKLRLLACGCWRGHWHLLTDERSRRALEMGERYADRLVDESERLAAREAAHLALEELVVQQQWEKAVAARGARAVVENRDDVAALAVGRRNQVVERKDAKPELRRQVVLLRCVLGNPFRPLAISTVVRNWQDGVVVRLAQAAYENRILPVGTLDRDRLAVLTDALEEAGVTETLLLEHLRDPGPHVRGCHVLDAILDRA